MMTGCCASSPSRKNPNTKFPCLIFDVVAASPPAPPVTGYITVANGNSSSGRSSLFAVW